jgi:hypothetical protein
LGMKKLGSIWVAWGKSSQFLSLKNFQM